VVEQQHYVLRYAAPEEDRLDHFLVASLPQYSRSRLQGLIRNGSVRVDGAGARKTGQLLGPGAVIEVDVPAPAPTLLRAENIPLDIVFENEDVIVVNKPAGIVVHPSVGHLNGTLVNAALGHDPDMEGVGGEERPGVVHRLDKDTSGLILLAKNDVALHGLQEQFRSRTIEKTYVALVDGRPPTAFGRIEAAIGRDPSHRKQMAIVADGKGRAAVTEYRTLETFPQHTLLELHPSTGRTHQIRLHCAFLGCPIVGDTVYGRKKPSLDIARHFLHASRLVVTLPDEIERRAFAAELPKELEYVLAALRTGTSAGGTDTAKREDHGIH
jgi:23S rRNA pseudouridine1911/1915/1917 synthase